MSKRRILKIVLWSIGATVGTAVLLVVGLAVYRGLDKRDTFVLQDAEFVEANCLQHLEVRKPSLRDIDDSALPVYAHRLKGGSGTIFAYRLFSNGTSAIDDETYRKATVWIAGPLPTSPIEIHLGDNSKALLVFSRGGSAWPTSGCSGYGTSGTVRIEPTGKRFTISILADIKPAGNRPPNQCEPEKLDFSFEAKEIAPHDLTPWLGLAGRHPYDETYR